MPVVENTRERPLTAHRAWRKSCDSFPSKCTTRKVPYLSHVSLLLISCIGATSSAFSPLQTLPESPRRSLSYGSNQRQQWSNPISQHRFDIKSSSAHSMSSLGKDPEERDIKTALSEWIGSKLPAPPEDQMTLSGDISCLFLYSFIDHYVNNLFDEYLNSPETIVTHSASAAIESSSAAMTEFSSSMLDTGVSSSSLPVWFDALSSAPFGTVPLSAALPIEHHITYAPAISEVGPASVILCTSWLLSGYLTGAFRFKNTLQCNTDKALAITAKTWILSSIFMLGIAWSSDLLVGNIDYLHKSVGVTKADADYIFDCLSVLLIWRYIMNAFFGYGDGTDE